ncbi:MAG: dephospho-CoA kinase [Desulfuromonas sp.]|nr:MAG: dephospho-CoA kinase [Desulfuromonas sp.]
MTKKVLILGITGGIASGKSLAASYFQRLGAELVSADALAREVVAPGSAVLEQLFARFGEGIRSDDGGLDREALAQIVFADEQARRVLNGLLHPAIGALAVERLRDSAQQCVPLVVYEAPLLFEAGAESRVDRVLVISVDEQVQLQRLMTRDGLSLAQAEARIAAQMPQNEKIERADYVIDNSATREALQRQVEALWRRLVAV